VTLTDQVQAGADRLVRQVTGWSPARWRTVVVVPAGLAAGEAESPELLPQCDVVFGLVQAVAALAAEAEGEPRRAVPWVAELALADQLVVVVHDLVAAGASDAVLSSALALLAEARRALS
jgi:hypothetical protein